MSTLPFFEWCESTALGSAIRDSLWLFPVIQAIHLLALALLGGAILVVDLRFFGLGLRRHSVAQVAEEAHPFLVGGLIVMISTGVLLFVSEAIKCYYSPPFWDKMTYLALALVFTFTVRRRVAASSRERVSPVWGKLVALASLGLWFGVGFSGRWIAFY